MNKLNGWQRIFVVYSVIHFLVGTVVAISLWPSTGSFSYEWDMKWKLHPADKFLIENVTRREPPSELSKAIHMPNGEYLIVRSFVSDDRMKELAENLYGIYSNTIKDEQRRHVGWYAFFITIPLCIIYSLGWAIAWIRRGFKSTKGT